MLDQASQTGKKPKGQAAAQAARERKLREVLGGKDAVGQFADPAVIFGLEG